MWKSREGIWIMKMSLDAETLEQKESHNKFYYRVKPSLRPEWATAKDKGKKHKKK